MTYTFQDKIVLITGGNSGIGLACVKKFLSLGAKVITTGRRELAELKNLSAEDLTLLKTMDYQLCDVTKPEDIDKLFTHIEKTYPRLDVAVNNAGISGPLGKAPLDFTLNDYQSVMDTNVRGVWLCMQHELKLMLSYARGNIVNTASIAGLKGNRTGPLYTMSKFAVNGLTRTMALQYAKSGIRINAVCPGVVDTPIVPPGMLDPLGATFPIGRVAKPAEIANAIAWLASEEAAYITGVNLPVDGGMMA